MMAEISITSESNVVGKGFNSTRRIGERSPLSSEDSNFNNNNNNNEINTLETPILQSNGPFANTNSTTNSSNRSPSQKNDQRMMTSPMMQITQMTNSTKKIHNEEMEDFGKDDVNPSGTNNSERIVQYSPVDKSHRHSSTSLPFEDNSKMILSHNNNKTNNKNSRDLPQIHQIHDEEEDELINENSDDEDNLIMEEEEDYSENEELMPGEDEDSEKDEHRITVREALMSRAFHAAKFGSGGKYSSTGSGGTGTTSRSGMISPLLPGGPHQHSQVQHHHMGNPLIKNPGVNGHGMRSDRHGQHNHGHGHHRSSFGSTGNHHNNSHHHLSSSRQYQQQQQSQQHHDEHFIKSERKSHPSSPIQCDLKPDSLATESSLNGIGNALLSLASLGSLAALQQSIPNFMANVVGSGGLGHHIASLQQQQNQNQPNSSTPGVPTLMNVPLNLTHSNTNSSTLTSNILTNSSNSSSHPHYPQQQHQKQSKQQQQQQCHLSPNSLISSSLQHAIANLAAGASSGGGTQNPGSATPPGQGSMPQLILASGQISQGIQGAQLLIPTSQGIMSQTVLTIPITQPGSPQNNMLSPSQQQQHLNSTGGGGGTNSGGHHSHNKNHNMNLSGHRNTCHPHSPSMTAGLPSSASPDFPGPGTLPSPLMNLAPHLVGGHLPTIQEKMVMDHNGGLNGLRNAHGKRERESNSSHTSGGLNVSALCPPKSSPCSAGGSSHGSDKCSDIDDSDQMVDGINLDEIKEFAKAFKLRRLSLGLTQTQVGQALSVTEGPAYSQSAICSALAWQLAQSQSQSYPPSSIHQQPMFEKLDITPKSAQKIKPVLERWMKEAEERYKNGHQNLNEFVGMEPSKKRKRRTSFTPQALEILNNHFERNTHPSGAEITTLAHQLGYEREVIRIWFCNKRQALKNTVRMMSK